MFPICYNIDTAVMPREGDTIQLLSGIELVHEEILIYALPTMFISYSTRQHRVSETHVRSLLSTCVPGRLWPCQCCRS